VVERINLSGYRLVSIRKRPFCPNALPRRFFVEKQLAIAGPEPCLAGAFSAKAVPS
jgi:hypothetical protein